MDGRRYDHKDVGGRVESGTEAENNARLQGCRRYDSREGGVRVKQEARTESDSGDKAEEQLSRVTQDAKAEGV